MSTPPPLNPDVHNIADRAKHGYATATQLLAATQYRLGELAGAGRLDRDESMKLQENLFHIWEALYAGILCAVRDDDTDDCTWDEADNTYSDGRQVIVQIRGNLRDAGGAQPIHARRRRRQRVADLDIDTSAPAGVFACGNARRQGKADYCGWPASTVSGSPSTSAPS